MPKYIFAYHGGRIPESKEEGDRVMAAWGKWFEGLGAAIADPGAPVGKSHTVSTKGVTADGGANPISGYTIVNATGYDTAVEMAKGCPILDGGSVEVAEIIQM
jgi:hypothetical protein